MQSEELLSSCHDLEELNLESLFPDVVRDGRVAVIVASAPPNRRVLSLVVTGVAGRLSDVAGMKLCILRELRELRELDLCGWYRRPHF